MEAAWPTVLVGSGTLKWGGERGAGGHQAVPSGLCPAGGHQAVRGGVCPAGGHQAVGGGVCPAGGHQAVRSGVCPQGAGPHGEAVFLESDGAGLLTETPRSRGADTDPAPACVHPTRLLALTENLIAAPSLLSLQLLA